MAVFAVYLSIGSLLDLIQHSHSVACIVRQIECEQAKNNLQTLIELICVDKL